MKRIINILFIFVLAVVVLNAQNSFVVVDNNDEPHFVPNIVFQKSSNGKNFSWGLNNDNGYQESFDISKLKFISRVNPELSSAGSTEVTEMLESMSGSDMVDADAVAATLQENPNVEEVYSPDDNNLVVKMNGEEGYTIYPMYELRSPFVDETILDGLSKMISEKSSKSVKNGRGVRGTVAIFMTLTNEREYRVQKRLVETIKKMLNDNGYTVQMYENGDFTETNLNRVVNHSGSYDAIIIMSHGALVDKPTFANSAKGVLVTGEECQKGDPCEKCWIESEGKYYKTCSNRIHAESSCLVYVGSCYGACFGEAFGETCFPDLGNIPFIGWRGVNSISQAHAAILFYRMLYENKTVREALISSFDKDPQHNTNLYYSKQAFNYSGLGGNGIDESHYCDNISFTMGIEHDKFIKKTGNDSYITMAFRIYGKWYFDSRMVELHLKPLFSNKTLVLKVNSFIRKASDDDSYFFTLRIPVNETLNEGVYRIEIKPYGIEQEIRCTNPSYLIYSEKFSDNYALPPASDEDTQKPLIVDANGESVGDITLPIGGSRTFNIAGYSGHSFLALSLNTDIVTVSTDGDKFTVEGVGEGSTYIGTYDNQNHQVDIAKVAVVKDENLGEIYTVNGVSFNMVEVEGGTFTMGATAEQGDDAFENEKPTHQVTLSNYSIGATEVTQELWQAVMGSNPSYFQSSNNSAYGENLQRPVERVSWNDCQEFITKLNQMTGKNFRLPTEAECEYAARGGNKSQGYKYSGSNTIDDVAWYRDNTLGPAGYRTTQTVGTKAPNELGLYDMSGNVGEWCQDLWGGYSSEAQINPTGPASGSLRVIRCGFCDPPRYCRVSYRHVGGHPDMRALHVGLRLAL